MNNRALLVCITRQINNNDSINNKQHQEPSDPLAAGTFPLGAIPVTASRGAGGSRRAGQVRWLPCGCRGRCGASLGSTRQWRLGQDAEGWKEARLCFTNALGHPILVPQQDPRKEQARAAGCLNRQGVRGYNKRKFRAVLEGQWGQGICGLAPSRARRGKLRNLGTQVEGDR